ncbi:hypothetical protein PSV08DRAFT_387769 [Bipolaris maydis]|uniref:uncharacterized protein n=1 Tax=Cochliobolus heterostrophus TaxID=5016 RepID=UPI0024D96D78|nr:hypothetical protein J3E73DRAFT_408073 [Bipolaris maydis]KAJ6273114.1 hypothetical protein PSV08DRAFT_387769 [Bipolaris maydis]
MVDRNRSLSSALDLIKRFVENWLQASNAFDRDDLAALVDALDCLKKDAQQKLSMKEATKAGIQSNKRLVSTGGANQGVRRSSRRIASAPRLASAASLFVNEHEAESESSDENNGASPETSAETSSVEHATMVAAVGTSFENASSLGESPIPNLHRAELVEAGHTFEPGTSPSMLCAAAVVNHQYEHTASQSAPALSLSNAQPYQSPFNTTYGVVEELSHSQQQAGIEPPPRASSNGLHQGLAEQDASISQAREMHLQVDDEEELGMHDAASPQFFNDAFEDLFGSSLQNESEMNFTDTSVGYIDVGEAAVGYMDVEEAAVGYMDVEEAIVDNQEQHAADQHHTQSFAQDPIFQSYLDFACRSNFQLPHETSEHTDQVEVRELLSPLVEGTPLTSKLLHGLIYLLVPGPLRVLELDSGVCDEELLPNESLVDNFALIFSQSTNGLSLLVLGDAEKKTLSVMAHTEIQAQENDIFVANLEGFDSDALHKVLRQRPAEIPRGRCLRILQCVHEIGCPYILESLKLAFTQKHEGHPQEAVQQPIVEKLFHIHLYLDRQETQNHLLVARSRYVKYCYFETYLLAVEALRKEKRDGTRENKKISALKQTTSFKLGLCNELPPTPHSDEIHRIYEDFSPVEKKRRAEDMVKNEISKKVAKVYRVEEKCIRRDINRYIREGRVLHYILQGGVVLNPSLLLLFPSFGTSPPSLSTARLGIELKEAEEKSLNKPIEAIWFGKVLQARPGLLEVVPKTILDLISDSPTEALDLHELDANRFRDRPLSFFMKPDSVSREANQDMWSCLGAIKINQANLLVFWESSWHSAPEYHALSASGHKGWLVHARSDDMLLIAWEPTIEKRSSQRSPLSLLYEPAVEIRKNRPGLLGFVATKTILDASRSGKRHLAFLAYWRVTPTTKEHFLHLEKTFSTHRGHIVHEEGDRVWVQWEPTWVLYKDLDGKKQTQLLRLSRDPEKLLRYFHKAVVAYSTLPMVEKRIR